MTKYPHPDFCRCTECTCVGLEMRREQRADAKRRIAEILAMRPQRAPFVEPDAAE